MPLIPLDLVDSQISQSPILSRPNPPRLTFPMIENAIRLPFNCKNTLTFRRLDNLADLDVSDIRRVFKAMILNIYGPVLTNYKSKIDDPVLEKIREINKKMGVCLIPDPGQRLPEELMRLGIPIAHEVVPKPDPRCYKTASQIYLGGVKPHQCVVVGSNFLTDATLPDDEMHYIHIKPKSGSESFSYRLFRDYGDMVSKMQDAIRSYRRRKKVLKALTGKRNPNLLLSQNPSTVQEATLPFNK